MKIGTPEWNDEMYRKHSTPYSGLAGFIEEQRVKSILKYADLTPDDRILEVGCESGKLLFRFPQCREVVGFDISQQALRDAEALFSTNGREARFIAGDASKPLPFTKGYFSVIVCSEMLEHVPDPAACVSAIADIADSQTRVILTVPNERPKLLIKKILSTLGVMRFLFPKIEEEQSEWHLQQFDKKQLESVCRGKLALKSVSNVLGMHWVASCRVQS